jgi:hypothetical protein
MIKRLRRRIALVTGALVASCTAAEPPHAFVADGPADELQRGVSAAHRDWQQWLTQNARGTPSGSAIYTPPPALQWVFQPMTLAAVRRSAHGLDAGDLPAPVLAQATAVNAFLLQQALAQTPNAEALARAIGVQDVDTLLADIAGMPLAGLRYAAERFLIESAGLSQAALTEQKNTEASRASTPVPVAADEIRTAVMPLLQYWRAVDTKIDTSAARAGCFIVAAPDLLGRADIVTLLPKGDRPDALPGALQAVGCAATWTLLRASPREQAEIVAHDAVTTIAAAWSLLALDPLWLSNAMPIAPTVRQQLREQLAVLSLAEVQHAAVRLLGALPPDASQTDLSAWLRAGFNAASAPAGPPVPRYAHFGSDVRALLNALRGGELFWRMNERFGASWWQSDAAHAAMQALWHSAPVDTAALVQAFDLSDAPTPIPYLRLIATALAGDDLQGRAVPRSNAP